MQIERPDFLAASTSRQRLPKGKPVRVLYPKADFVQIAGCWMAIFANAALIAWCFVWVGSAFGSLAPGPLQFAAMLVVGLFLADWFSGFVHWATDTWFDEIMLERLISIAREHHIYPRHILGYGFRDYVAYSSWPTVFLIGPICLLFTLALPRWTVTFDGALICLVVAVAMFFGTYAHRLGHRQSDSRIVRWLQRHHMLISPAYHARHHRANHDTHYCVINGWANIVCDRIGFWRWAERLVERVLGATPRRSDHQWFARFRADPSFPPGRLALERARAADRA
jgi:ubiquitin-conjugating enzyme E2 variant